MTLRTAFTELFNVEHPIASAPMGGSAGGALAAAVSEAGGLGLVGGGRGGPGWVDREVDIAAGSTTRPWGVGFLSWAADIATVERALARGPSAVMLSFGDPTPFVQPIRDAGAALIIQVTDLGEAEQAMRAGADVIVAQGAEAGGHGGSPGRSTFSFVPVVVDLAAPTPVLAAGGIADGRGVAAALALGAAGALIGTRFQATLEALVDASVTKAIIDGRGADTERSTILDIAGGTRWPSRYPGRALRHPLVEQWRAREDELAADDDARQAYRDSVARGEMAGPVWASEAIDLITDVQSAADVVGTLAADAESTLTRLGSRPVRDSPPGT